MYPPERAVTAALMALIILQAIMLMSLYAGVPPHPPVSTPLFGIGPFIGAAVAMAAASIVVGPLSSPLGRTLAALAVAFALASFGPQKYFNAQFGLIWPAVLTAQGASAIIVFHLVRSAAHQKPPNESAV